MDPAAGYDLWSSTYDEERDNVLVALDERIFRGLLERVQVRGRRVIDVGCGTGRHWGTILAKEPAELIGYDISACMLAELRHKYPHATVHEASAECLADAPNQRCDLVISTLTLCHVSALDRAIREWARVLRPGGAILLTDFHPSAAATCQCSFRQGGKSFTVKLHVHTIASLEAAAARSRLELLALEEAVVDESTKPYYRRARMLPMFERMKGTPLVYGAYLRKPHSDSP
jgi:ubiquinone/menaquinone biosynthesis C-methylase UbiE